MDGPERRRGSGASWRVQTMGSWGLRRDGVDVRVPHRPQRLVGLLAVQGRLPRPHVAAVLWPASSEAHAAANLRTTVVELRRRAPGLLDASAATLQLAVGVGCDLADLVEMLGASRRPPGQLAEALVAPGDLLRGWTDDWVANERYRLQVLMIDTVAVEVQRLVATDDLDQALTLARTATRMEPTRESTHRTLTQIHLSSGDLVEAWQVYEDFHRRSVRDFGVGASPIFQQLIEPLRAERRARRVAARASTSSAPSQNGRTPRRPRGDGASPYRRTPSS